MVIVTARFEPTTSILLLHVYHATHRHTVVAVLMANCVLYNIPVTGIATIGQPR